MAAPVVASYTTYEGTSETTSADFVKPSGVASGDLLVLIVGNDDSNSTNPAINTPSGWTQRYQAGDANVDNRHCIFTRVADGTEGSTTTVTMNGTADYWTGFYLRITGADASTFIIGTGVVDTDNTTSVDIPALTTTGSDFLVVASVTLDGADGGTATASGTGWSNAVVTARTSDLGNAGGSTAWTYKTVASAGTSSVCTFTWSTGDGNTGVQFAVGPSSGPSPITGTSTQTLANFTSSASGTYTPPPITGTSAQTLANFTSSASGTHTPPAITGTSAQTLSNFASTASGTHTPPSFSATSAQTLANFTSSASGTHTPPSFTATSAQTLANFTSTASGSFVGVSRDGSAAVTLANATSTASGTFTPPPITGTSAQTLANFTSTASGTRTVPSFTGTSAQTLANFTSTASGTRTVPSFTATSAQTLANFTSTASGTFTPPAITGTSAQTLANFTSAASGTFLSGFAATAAVTLADATSAASGTYTAGPITGSGAVTLESVVGAGVGVRASVESSKYVTVVRMFGRRGRRLVGARFSDGSKPESI